VQKLLLVLQVNDDIPELSIIRIAISTKNMIGLAKKRKHICADATYKLIWQGKYIYLFFRHEYSINICTTETDADFAFMFRAIINALFVHHDKFEYKPNCLIADAAPAIHNGFMAAQVSLDEFCRVMCWSHVERNCEEWMRSIEHETREKIFMVAITY
jgi:hypothetical protein